MKKTLVLGASSNPSRYAYLAVERLQGKGHEVVAVGSKQDEVLGVAIQDKLPKHIENLDTITLYINPQIQKSYYDALLNLNPKRIIFNPGTENRELYKMAKEKGIEVLEACTLVLLSINKY